MFKCGCKKKYDNFLEQSRALLSIDKGFTILVNKREVSHNTLQEMEKEIMHTIKDSLDLLIRLLQPVVQDLEKINKDMEQEMQETTRMAFSR